MTTSTTTDRPRYLWAGDQTRPAMTYSSSSSSSSSKPMTAENNGDSSSRRTSNTNGATTNNNNTDSSNTTSTTNIPTQRTIPSSGGAPIKRTAAATIAASGSDLSDALAQHPPSQSTAIGKPSQPQPSTSSSNSRPVAARLTNSQGGNGNGNGNGNGYGVGGGPFGQLSNVPLLNVSRSSSVAGASPQSSRDPSPAGPAFRQAARTSSLSSSAAVAAAVAAATEAASGAGTSSSSSSRDTRSRKNSHEVSPHRLPQPSASSSGSTSSQSAAAIHRALSLTSAIPQLQPTIITTTEQQQQQSRLPRSQKANGTAEPLTSSRMRSPPPSQTPRKNSLKSSRPRETNGISSSSVAPNIIVQQAQDDILVVDGLLKETENLAPKSSGLRSAASSAPTLETVEEGSAPVTPNEGDAVDQSKPEKNVFAFISDEERPSTAVKDVKDVDSGSDVSSKRSSSKQEDSTDPDATPRPAASAKLKPDTGAEPTLKNMTVETETISSIPQSTLGPAADRVASTRVDSGGTLRVKVSNETIRPKKERKKASRKAPSMHAASSSTRADIFEDRVKNAMDEATSDDSDETFVYESNPPEPQPRRSRHHSRTPSGASLASMGGEHHRNNAMRSIANALDPQRVVPKARSMKFASNNSNYGTAEEDLGGPDGTIRVRDRNGGSSVQHHHHLGRQSRGATGHSSILDDENPLFPQLSKARSLTGLTSRGSHAAKLAAQHLRPSSMNRRAEGYSSYDMDAEGGDDERTPLMGTVRTPRSGARSSRTTRARYSSSNNDLYNPPRLRRRSLVSRFAGCIVLLFMLLFLAFGVVAFLFAFSKPLTDVAIVDIQSVLASEQEIMLDLVVQAINPNLVPISVADMDVNIFARSKYVGSEKWWREHDREPIGEDPAPSNQTGEQRRGKKLRRKVIPSRGPLAPISTRQSIGITLPDPEAGIGDPGPSDPSVGQTMLLGHILHFDNPLSFDGSFWKRQPHYSSGSLRLSKPGNRTEAGGTERWERVLKHEFELIVRGVLRYGIPLGGRTINVPISGEVWVKGNGGKDDKEGKPGWDGDPGDDDGGGGGDDGGGSDEPSDDSWILVPASRG